MTLNSLPWAEDVVLGICTRNRANRLDACLERAVAQNCDADWGVLVVDSASTDHTPDVLTRWVERFPARIRAIRLEKKGTGRARAAAVEFTDAPILAFTDDDCYAEPDFLQSIVETFRLRPELGCIGGRVMLHDSADYPITICESLEPVEIQPCAIVRAGFIHGANMAFRRVALVEAGGFDPRVGPGTPFCFEDIDIAARVNGAGWHIAYVPKPTVRHHHGRQSEAEVEDLRRFYDKGRGAFYTKMTLAGEWRYLKYWLYTLRRYPVAISLREIRGGLHFLLVA